MAWTHLPSAYDVHMLCSTSYGVKQTLRQVVNDFCLDLEIDKYTHCIPLVDFCRGAKPALETTNNISHGGKRDFLPIKEVVFTIFGSSAIFLYIMCIH